MTFTVYGAVRSRTFRVLWMLEELDITYLHIPMQPQSDEVRALTPSGKIPVLDVDGTYLSDSSAILTYLADSHGRFTCPAGSLDRARQDAFTFRILDEIEAPLWCAARHSFVLPEEARVPEIKPACRADYAVAIARLFDEVEGPFLMGEEMTVPDFILGHCGGWARSANFPDPPQAFADYLDRLRDRPAFQTALG